MFRPLGVRFIRVSCIGRVPVRLHLTVHYLQAVDKEVAEKGVPLLRRAAAKYAQRIPCTA